MNVSDILQPRGIRPLKHSLHENPHLVLEPNYTCNLKCIACYNLDKQYVKSFEEVKKEIDLGLAKRNLETISILGGEPTLHPDLPQIIKYIKDKKLYCQLLTNGIRFLEDEKDHLLKTIIKSGVDRIILHVDRGQKISTGEIDNRLQTLCAKLENHRIYYSFSLTVYQENSCVIAGLVKKYARYPYFDGILALLERDALLINGNKSAGQVVELLPEYLDIREKLGIEPVCYIPTSLDDEQISWLMYFYYINANTGISFRISPRINRIFRKLYRFVKGKQVFGMAPKPVFFIPNFILSMLFEFLLNPLRIQAILQLVKKSSLLSKLRFHYILIQRGPEYNADQKIVQLCYHCPDATIRNGKITPVCLADLINPVTPQQGRPVPDELYKTVYTHLEEM